MNDEANRMDCAQFEELSHDLDRPGTQGMALREGALVHAESCSRCAQLMTQAESLNFSLRSLARREASAQAPLRVETALLEEFRRAKAGTSRRRTGLWLAALGLASAVLLALGLSVRKEPAPDRKSLPAIDVGANASSSTAVSAPEMAPERRQKKSSLSEEDDAEYATPYVSLPYTGDPETLEGGAVVRVVLSRSALASLGFPVTDVGAPERIPADIVLSEDGAPQAIRLVSRATID
jgi:hypothetical protein